MEAVTATYVQHDEDWTITVNGCGRELTARAPGIIAARDRADQLVEKLPNTSDKTTVVHLLNGNALDFTAAYMQARLTRPARAEDSGAAADDEGSAGTETPEADADEADEPDEAGEPDEPAAAAQAVG